MSIKSKKILDKIVIPYSQFFKLHHEPDIYSGDEQITFEQRHPIYKALLKAEFEDAIIQFHNRRKEKR